MAVKRFDESRRAVLAAASGVGLGLVACSDSTADGAGGAGGGGSDDLADVIYEGGASDEALEALLAQTAEDDAAEGTRFLAPAEDAALDATTPASFEWAVGTTAQSAPSPTRPPARPAREEGLLERAVGVLLGVKTAHAHGTPVNGRAYFLVLGTASSPKLVRVFTTNLSYTPAAAVWQRLVDAGEPITGSITNAIFEDNRVAQGGGPFAGTELHFTVV
ncbi:MAG: hypothetical protein IPM79_00670 [Polyangiaceae bacterium]|nr:hypothetical protein [Polyangiaceae bacterium]MBK8936190.1 hypothetical protein [Polyangiaceae bacterium]